MMKLWKENADEDKPVLFCPMIDARRMEVFAALYDNYNNCVRKVEAEVIDEGSFSLFLANNIVVFSGTGAQKTETVLGGHPRARFLPGFVHSAAHAATIAEEKYIKKEFEDVAYFEPFYLKDFVAGKPRVKGLYS
jgi:tRNA threonylcarbamoyladenosine biosynthesis protein TsaB